METGPSIPGPVSASKWLPFGQNGRSSSSSCRAPGNSSKSSEPAAPAVAPALALLPAGRAGRGSPASPPRGDPSMISSRTLISVEYLVWPSLSCHCRYSIRPSTNSLSPFFTYFSTMSASWEFLLFQTTQRCHSVFSCLLPLASFHERLVANEKLATRLPPAADRTSGSLPRFPISVTLFKLRLTLPPGECSVSP